jgi:hypothetical protein
VSAAGKDWDRVGVDLLLLSFGVAEKKPSVGGHVPECQLGEEVQHHRASEIVGRLDGDLRISLDGVADDSWKYGNKVSRIFW